MPRIQRSFRRVSKRLVEWRFAVSTTTFDNVPVSSKVLLAASGDISNAAPATIVRTRGLVTVVPVANAASIVVLGAMGIGLVSQRAAAVGITAIPGPITDSLWDGWFVHQFLAARKLTRSDIGFDSQDATHYVIDSKAMRKFEGSQQIVFVVENENASNAFDVALQVRLLVKAG